MPIYHFNLHDGRAYPDALGSEWADVPAAKAEAARRMAGMLAENASRFWTGDEWTMTVTDHSGLALFRLVFFAMDSPSFEPRD